MKNVGPRIEEIKLYKPQRMSADERLVYARKLRTAEFKNHIITKKNKEDY